MSEVITVIPFLLTKSLMAGYGGDPSLPMEFLTTFLFIQASHAWNLERRSRPIYTSHRRLALALTGGASSGSTSSLWHLRLGRSSVLAALSRSLSGKFGTHVGCSVRLTGYIDWARSLLRRVPSLNCATEIQTSLVSSPFAEVASVSSRALLLLSRTASIMSKICFPVNIFFLFSVVPDRANFK